MGFIKNFRNYLADVINSLSNTTRESYDDYREIEVFSEAPWAYPAYAHEGDAAIDVKAFKFVEFWSYYNEKVVIDEDIDEFILHPGQRLKIYTGLRCNISDGLGIFATIRSGISSENGIIVVNSPGIIDNPYGGEICLVFANISGVPYKFKKKDRIGQLTPFKQIRLLLLGIGKGEIEDTTRGSSGFGSSGK